MIYNCIFCNSSLYKSALDYYICYNHKVTVRFYFSQSIELAEYYYNNFSYQVYFPPNYCSLTTIYKSHHVGAIFESNSIILISPEDLKRKLPLLTVFV